jgi:hypothetical protein
MICDYNMPISRLYVLARHYQTSNQMVLLSIRISSSYSLRRPISIDDHWTIENIPSLRGSISQATVLSCPSYDRLIFQGLDMSQLCPIIFNYETHDNHPPQPSLSNAPHQNQVDHKDDEGDMDGIEEAEFRLKWRRVKDCKWWPFDIPCNVVNGTHMYLYIEDSPVKKTRRLVCYTGAGVSNDHHVIAPSPTDVSFHVGQSITIGSCIYHYGCEMNGHNNFYCSIFDTVNQKWSRRERPQQWFNIPCDAHEDPTGQNDDGSYYRHCWSSNQPIYHELSASPPLLPWYPHDYSYNDHNIINTDTIDPHSTNTDTSDGYILCTATGHQQFNMVNPRTDQFVSLEWCIPPCMAVRRRSTKPVVSSSNAKKHRSSTPSSKPPANESYEYYYHDKYDYGKIGEQDVYGVHLSVVGDVYIILGGHWYDPHIAQQPTPRVPYQRVWAHHVSLPSTPLSSSAPSTSTKDPKEVEFGRIGVENDEIVGGEWFSFPSIPSQYSVTRVIGAIVCRV